MRIYKYRRQRAGKQHSNDQGFVEYNGKRFYFPEPYNSAVSVAAYKRFQRAIMAEEPPLPDATPGAVLSIVEVAVRYLDHILAVQRKVDGTPSEEYGHVRRAIRPLLDECADLPIGEFGPKALKRVRARMLTVTKNVGKAKTAVPANWSRSYINEQVARIRRFINWAVSEEFATGAMLEALRTVKALKEGDTTAPEGRQVLPVDSEVIDAVIPYLSPPVAAIVKIQQLTGMRSSEVCSLRPLEIDRSADPWEHRPIQHKTKKRGFDRVVFFGPEAQEILRSFLNRADEAFLFSPAEATAWSHDQQWKKSRSAASGKKPKVAKTPRRIGNKYNARTYRKAIMYGIAKANKDRDKNGLPRVAHWHPHQVRHTRGTLVRKKYSLEGAQVVLGHKHANVTQIYAERDLDLARKIAREMGLRHCVEYASG